MSCYFRSKLVEVPQQEVDARIEEALKFLNIAAYHSDVSIPVTEEIDDIWHLWILETQEYERLCSLLQGRKFLHHRSNTYARCTNGRVKVPANSLEDDVAV